MVHSLNSPHFVYQIGYAIQRLCFPRGFLHIGLCQVDFVPKYDLIHVSLCLFHSKSQNIKNIIIMNSYLERIFFLKKWLLPYANGRNTKKNDNKFSHLKGDFIKNYKTEKPSAKCVISWMPWFSLSSEYIAKSLVDAVIVPVAVDKKKNQGAHGCVQFISRYFMV